MALNAKYSESHALVIGINKYKSAPPLGYAVNDAIAIARVLSDKFSFQNVHLLTDQEATRSAILERYLSLACDGTNADDRAIVFFAGHGHTVKSSRSEVGYLVPWDGDIQNLASLIRWDELTRNADLIEAKHVLFLMDACYGGLAVTRAIQPGTMRFLKDMLLRRSRQVLTAGKADEVVVDLGGPLPDHSVFTGHLLEALDGKAMTPEGILTANGVVAYVYRSVSVDLTSQQTPHFGYLAGDGDLIFGAPNDALVLGEDDPLISQDTLVSVPGILVTDAGDQMTLVEQTKEFLSEERFKIRLHDLVSAEVRGVLSATAEDSFSVQGRWSGEEFVSRTLKYEEICAELLRIQALLGCWGEPYHRSLLTLTAKHLCGRLKVSGGNSGWLSLRYYPVLLLLYSGGIAAVSASKYENLRELMLIGISDPDRHERRGRSLICTVGEQMTVLHDAFREMPGHERQYTPQSEYLLKMLQPLLGDLLFLGAEYESHFDRFEVLYALEYANQYSKENGGRVWGPIGRFGWKARRGYDSPFDRVVSEAEFEGVNWRPIQAGLFDGSIERFKQVAADFRELLARLSWH